MPHHEDDDLAPEAVEENRRQRRMRSTHTVATLEVSHAAYDEIRIRLEKEGYGHTIQHDGTIDLTGIGLVRFETNPSRTHLPSVTSAERDVPTENQRQVGGKHYGLGSFQHWDVVAYFHLDYFQGQITKYVMRWRDKNGIQDLKKAQHFLEKYIAIEEENSKTKATDAR